MTASRLNYSKINYDPGGEIQFMTYLELEIRVTCFVIIFVIIEFSNT